MAHRPRDNEVPKTEEQTTEFDGTSTDRLSGKPRVRVVTSDESASGTVGFDDRGQPQWKWVTELGPSTNDISGTFDQLRALDNPALTLEDAPPPERTEPPRKVGYDPYATQGPTKPKRRR